MVIVEHKIIDVYSYPDTIKDAILCVDRLVSSYTHDLRPQLIIG